MSQYISSCSRDCFFVLMLGFKGSLPGLPLTIGSDKLMMSQESSREKYVADVGPTITLPWTWMLQLWRFIRSVMTAAHGNDLQAIVAQACFKSHRHGDVHL